MYINIILKTAFLYFFIILSYRIMGKKEVGQLGIIDLIVSILIAELAAMSIEETERSILISVIPIVVLVVIQITLSYITLKNSKIRKIIDGNPRVIIKNGKISFSEMEKLRYSLDDLMSQLREQGIRSLEEVQYAVLENNGKLSIFDKEDIYPLPIIIDGVIDYEVIKDMGKNVAWVKNILNQKNIELQNVFYAFHAKGKTFIIKKDELI